MFGHNRRLVPPDLFVGFDGDVPSPEALDEFKSALIIAYEQALEDGISASAAIAAMLDLMSAEFKRCVHIAG
jgi:hypothetical protein